MLQNGPLGSYADLTSTSELLFASFSNRVLVQNVSHENDLIFMRMNIQVTYSHLVLHWQRLSLPQKQKSNWNWSIHPWAGTGGLWFFVKCHFSGVSASWKHLGKEPCEIVIKVVLIPKVELSTMVRGRSKVNHLIPLIEGRRMTLNKFEWPSASLEVADGWSSTAP